MVSDTFPSLSGWPIVSGFQGWFRIAAGFETFTDAAKRATKNGQKRPSRYFTISVQSVISFFTIHKNPYTIEQILTQSLALPWSQHNCSTGGRREWELEESSAVSVPACQVNKAEEVGRGQRIWFPRPVHTEDIHLHPGPQPKYLAIILIPSQSAIST